MSSSPPPAWSDRRGLFQTAREVHQPTVRREESTGIAETVRRASISSIDKIEKAVSSTPAPTATSERRRSSAASQGLFGNLSHHKRGSEDYAERRASHSDQAGAGGMVSGWWNSTFRGYQSGGQAAHSGAQTGSGNATEAQKRGVME